MVPFALVGRRAGGVADHQVRRPGEGGLTIGSLVGFVDAVRHHHGNSIMMISHFEHLVTEEGMTWGPEAGPAGRLRAADAHP